MRNDDKNLSYLGKGNMQNILSPSWYFKVLPREELESIILEAANRTSINEDGCLCNFSINDLYLEMEVGDSKIFQAQKSTIWEKRFELISIGFVSYVLKKHGYFTNCSGKVSVKKWRRESLDEIIDCDQLQREKIEKQIREKAAAARSQAAIIEG